MSETTSRLQLYKPADDGSEPINVATDLNDNLDRIDSAVGFVPSTSATPPANPYSGMASYESDTGIAKFFKGSTWTQLLAKGSTFLSHLNLGNNFRIGINSSTPSAIVDAVVDNIFTYPMIKYKASGEATHRLQIDYDGIRIGGGQVAPDIRLYRPGPGQLTLQGSVSASDVNLSGTLTANSITATNLSLNGTVNTDLNINGDIAATGTGYTRMIRKLTDEPRTNTTTAVIDPEMYVDLPANSYWVIEAYLLMSGTTGDIKTSWNLPANAVGLKWALGPDVSATAATNVTMRVSVGGAGTETSYGLYHETFFVGAKETMVVTMGATAGRVQLKFAQNTATAITTNLRTNSFMKVTKID